MNKGERDKLSKEKLEKKRCFDAGFHLGDSRFVAGVDEAGRGPLAGPVVAACVILAPDFNIVGIDDSKKLSAKKREELEEIIKTEALAYGVAEEGQNVIDEINILEATKRAMKMAIKMAEAMLMERKSEKVTRVLIDALEIWDLGIPQRGVVGGDAKSLSIGAASILAKTHRDREMTEYSRKYPGYGFESHKGYGTKAHYEALKKLGICPIHRKSFLKNRPELLTKK